MRRRLQIVEVLWDDIAGYGSEWRDAASVSDCVHVEARAVGYLWSKGKNLKIVGTVTNDCGVGDINVIPSGVVRDVKVLGTVTLTLSDQSASKSKKVTKSG